MFPFQMAIHGLYMGVILTPSKSWNDPPSKIIKPQTTLIYKVSQ